MTARRAGLGVGAALALVAGAAHAAQHQDGNVHQWWSLPAPAYNVDQAITVRAIEDGTYFALVVWFEDVADGAYMGLQQLAGGARLARFSVWNSTAATPGGGATCRDFDGEGVGKTCELPLAFTLDHPYRMRLWQVSADAQGTWWGAWIIDDVSGVESLIGQVRAPAPAGGVIAADTFDEYFGEAVPCDAVPWSAADVAPPTLNAGAALATALPPSLGACSGGRVSEFPGGVRLELGREQAGEPPPGGPDAGGGPNAGADAGGAPGDGASVGGGCAASGGADLGAALWVAVGVAASRRRRRGVSAPAPRAPRTAAG